MSIDEFSLYFLCRPTLHECQNHVHPHSSWLVNDYWGAMTLSPLVLSDLGFFGLPNFTPTSLGFDIEAARAVGIESFTDGELEG